jgi:hypothetical protein
VFDVGDDVIDLLNPNGDTHQSIDQPPLFPSRRQQIPM